MLAYIVPKGDWSIFPRIDISTVANNRKKGSGLLSYCMPIVMKQSRKKNEPSKYRNIIFEVVTLLCEVLTTFSSGQGWARDVNSQDRDETETRP